MARSIGSLGTAREPLDLEFDYFGSPIRVHPAASDTVELDFLEAGKDIDLAIFDADEASLKAMDDDEKIAALGKVGQAVRAGYTLVRGGMRQLIHPDDFDTYWKLAKDNGQRIGDLMADMKRLTAAVVEADTGFPTTPPSGSPDGRAPTPPRSADGSSSAAPRPASDADKALALFRGRPDLQEFVVMEEEVKADLAQQEADQQRRDMEKLQAAGLA